ncbi:3-oxoacyl-[acyl-carrier-protein] synthase III C-terminal domain-containing protein [Stackebrandtia nassauensis]|uniref:3-oxoacyl-[acyl-carrier-protein] synthase III C-terminal domain-containing protein n=1 Tax=Stackebrandtia nassauensis TaxID=283811 RepID=UPI0001A395C7|nr:3-oxoacyl-[acyl-carrier-protein] synthase III C-terminal domain-containing protein [Stackebrandtia nassauensis]
MAGYFAMRGKEVFAHAVRRMSDSSRAVLKTVGWTVSDVDHCVAHQANIRILHSVADRLGLDRAKAAVHLDRVGNTSAASIPLALADRVAHGALTRGDRVLLTAFGGGFTWGSTALEWPDIDLKQ